MANGKWQILKTKAESGKLKAEIHLESRKFESGNAGVKDET
jgi:hypothetical protein